MIVLRKKSRILGTKSNKECYSSSSIRVLFKLSENENWLRVLIFVGICVRKVMQIIEKKCFLRFKKGRNDSLVTDCVF